MTLNSNSKKQNLPIWRDANRLLVEIERSVRKFPRYHKYTVGSDLRRLAMDVCRGITRAAHLNGINEEVKREQERALERLGFAIEDLKTTIQLAKELEAFASFAEFAQLAELAVVVGKQSGGWRKAARARARPEVQPGVVKASG